jgi:hypothetical protein
VGVHSFSGTKRLTSPSESMISADTGLFSSQLSCEAAFALSGTWAQFAVETNAITARTNKKGFLFIEGLLNLKNPCCCRIGGNTDVHSIRNAILPR